MSPLHGKLPEYPIFQDFSEIKRVRTTVCTRRSSSPLLQIETPGYEARVNDTVILVLPMVMNFCCMVYLYSSSYCFLPMVMNFCCMVYLDSSSYCFLIFVIIMNCFFFPIVAPGV